MKEKVVLVTGSSRGIGEATIIEFAKNGYNVVINYSKSNKEAEVLKEKIERDYKVKALVIEADGRTRRTREPAIMYFFKKKWFNVIAQLKADGISYYCNIATPYIIEDGTIKYIDYDLDLRIFNTGEYKILDKMEYKYHKKIMNYSDELDIAVKNGLNELIKLYKSGSDIFSTEKNMNYYKEYLELKK